MQAIHHSSRSKSRWRLQVESLEPRALLAADLLTSSTATAAIAEVDAADRIRYSSTGQTYYADVFQFEAALAAENDEDDSQDDESATENSTKIPLSELPAYNSLPGSANTFYLDFTGGIVTDTDWNVDYDDQPIHARPFDKDGDTTTFSQPELDIIYEVWQRVSEDFLPFNINVTTVEPDPPTLGFRSARAIITHGEDDSSMGGTGDVWFPDVGGVAYVGAWVTNRDAPAWVFHNAVPKTAKGIAEATAHELGHIVGLSHHGDGGSAYYAGHGTGETSWAPIMGAGYRKNITQWSQGKYEGASNAQDDIKVITNRFNDIDFRADDHNEKENDGTPIVPDETGRLTASGIIEKRRDYDVFVFEHPGGPVSFEAKPAAVGGNLDIEAAIYDYDIDLLLEFEPHDSTSVTIAIELDPGTYYLEIAGGNHLADQDQGYSDYGSLGAYTIEGSLGVDVLVADAGGNYSIDEGTTLVLDASESFGADEDTTFRWDLDDDGEFDDAEGIQVERTWEQLAELPVPIVDQGVYRIGLEVTNGTTTDVAIANVTIANLPPRIETQPVHGFANVELVIDLVAEDVSADSLLFEWDFGDATDSHITSTHFVLHTYTEPGEYVVEVNVGDDEGDFSTASFVVTVEAPIAGDADYDGQVTFSDFLILSANFGKETVTWQQGDFDQDGQVTFADFLLLSQNFGIKPGE